MVAGAKWVVVRGELDNHPLRINTPNARRNGNPIALRGSLTPHQSGSPGQRGSKASLMNFLSIRPLAIATLLTSATLTHSYNRPSFHRIESRQPLGRIHQRAVRAFEQQQLALRDSIVRGSSAGSSHRFMSFRRAPRGSRRASAHPFNGIACAQATCSHLANATA